MLHNPNRQKSILQYRSCHHSHRCTVLYSRRHSQNSHQSNWNHNLRCSHSSHRSSHTNMPCCSSCHSFLDSLLYRRCCKNRYNFQYRCSYNCPCSFPYFNDREHHVRDTTMDTKRNVFDTKIVPLLGNRKMNEITALDIRDWQQRVKEMGEATGLPYSETYLYTIHAQLTALFNYAQTFYGLRFNPCDAAGYMGSSVAGEMLIITKDQYELLRKEFRNEAYLLAFDILFWTGCREGEMLALLPKDLTDDDQLRIYKTYHRKKGQDIFGPTKNSKKGGNRNVPIPHWLAEEFRTYCSRLYGLTPDDRVFYMTCTALNKELTRCTQLTYLPDIRVHDLRHSHVSLCIELGYSVVLVARRIGDTVPVVMRTYAHLYPNKQQELVSRLEAIGSPSSNDDESDLMSLG